MCVSCRVVCGVSCRWSCGLTVAACVQYKAIEAKIAELIDAAGSMGVNILCLQVPHPPSSARVVSLVVSCGVWRVR